MKKTVNYLVNLFIVPVLIFMMSGCSVALDRTLTKKVSDEELISSVSKIVDEQLEIVSPYFEENTKAIEVKELTGEKVVQGALTEDLGKEYLRFNYTVAVENDESLEDIAYQAKSLIPESEAYRIDDKLNETRDFMDREISKMSKSIPPSQQIAFQKDLRELVTRSFVLFTAGIVYIFMPETMFWGKVSAAAAISVATGVLSCTVMSLYQYYKYGGDAQETFAQWVNEISSEPQVSFALANSMIAVGKTMNRSPIVTGIMICVFSMYQVIDMVKPMLKKYSFAS
jgi:hypothetical protein